MADSDHRRSAQTEFYQEDIVQHVGNPRLYGIVSRCWHDPEEHPNPFSADSLLRPLQHHEIGVTFLPSPTDPARSSPQRQILPSQQFRLVDRTFVAGEYVKRRVEDVESAVVTGVDVKVRLEHAVTGEELKGWFDGWFDESEVKAASVPDMEVGDYVFCGEWIGQIVDMYDEAIIETSNYELVSYPDLRSGVTVGDRAKDLFAYLAGPDDGEALFARLNARRDAWTPREYQLSPNDRIVAVNHLCAAVSWLAINQTLDPHVSQHTQRPARLWSDLSSGPLVLFRSNNASLLRTGTKVKLSIPDPKSPQSSNSSSLPARSIPCTRHGQGRSTGKRGVDCSTFVVKETRTRVSLLWGDGRREENVAATDLIPYLNPDEHDCWPGDLVLHKTEDAIRPAGVQSVNSSARTALLRYLDSPEPTIELASLLEVDPHGVTNAVTGEPPDGLGLRRGDLVFIHKPNTTNGFTTLSGPGESTLKVPKIGESEHWVRDMAIDHGGSLIGWRKDMAEQAQAAKRRMQERNQREDFEPARSGTQVAKARRLNWFGEVIDLKLDGTVEVALPTGENVVVPLNRLTRLADTMEQIEQWDDEDAEMEEDYDGFGVPPSQFFNHAWLPTVVGTNSVTALEEVQDDGPVVHLPVTRYGLVPNGSAQRQLEIPSQLTSVFPSFSMREEDEDNPFAQPEGPVTVQEAVLMPELTGAADQDVDEDADMLDVESIVGSTETEVVPESRSEPSQELTSPPQQVGEPIGQEAAINLEDSGGWKRFDVLPSAPVDHAFYNTSPSQPSRKFMTRLQKEYRTLQRDLSESIIVRAYEDRSDLLRSLIIGPENTPYEDAPFVIDWMLDSNFPQSPPIAHFLSWTNGNGRVNPNLYEEGKVCLSILGTWSGDRNESWNPAQSSLLQVLISIQGLVLVKEPWFCEPAYEKLRGTEEGIVNSRLYNERAYCLSRGFVRRALEIPLGSLRGEIEWLYYDTGRLAKLLHDSQALIVKSKTTPEDSEADRDLAVPRLSQGGIITLERTLAKLASLLEAHR